MCQARTIFPLSIPYFCLIIKINRRTMTKIKEEHSFQRVRLMKQAAAIRQNNGMNRHDALVTAHRIGALIRQMHHGNVRFHYTKQDGSVRHAIGTLTGYEHSFHQPYIPRPENTFVVYYDIEAKGWRTFHAENFLDIDAEDEPEKTRTE
nr:MULTISPECIES: SH3 beta-barrel fold-containing protein [Bacteroides]